MARNGFKIFDADTHVRPDADLLEPYMSAPSRQRLPQYDSSKARNKDGAVTYLMGERSYKRRLGLAGEAAPGNKDYMSGYKRHQHGKPNPLCERDPAIRIQDMDVEGVDVNLMLPSGWFGCWTTIDDVSLETAVYEAYHRWMADYCVAFPKRLKGVILVAARDIKLRSPSCTDAQRNRGRWRSSSTRPISFPWTIPILNRYGRPRPTTI